MDINIDKNAATYIKEKTSDKSVHLGIQRIGGGWSSALQPFVKMGEPFDKDTYKHYLVEDIHVYIPNILKAKNNKVSISYSKFLWMKNLNVDGVIV